MKATTTAKKEHREALLELLKPGDTVYCVLRSVSRSGMSRRVDFYLIRDNSPRWITSRIAGTLDYSFDYDTPGLRVNGCGMDMGFAVVDHLSWELFGKGGEIRHDWV